MENKSTILKQCMSCTLVLLLFLVVILATIVFWPYITPYITPKNTPPPKTSPEKSTTPVTPCTVPGSFNDSCLQEIWKGVGCTTELKSAMNGLSDGKSYPTQLKYWNGLALGDVFDDMKLWASSTNSAYHKKACLNQ